MGNNSKLSVFLVVAVVLFVSGCGGSSGGGGNQPETPIISLSEGVALVSNSNIDDIVSIASGDGDSTVVILQGESANNVKKNDVLNILPGDNNGFPLGLAGRITNITVNGDGSKSIELEPVSYSDVVSEASTSFSDIPLNAENFVGVIAPSAVHASQSTSQKKAITAHDYYSFRNGAVIVESLGRTHKIASKSANDTINAGKVSLNIEIDISDMNAEEREAPQDNPQLYDTELSGKFVISGVLDNIKLTNKHDFSFFDGGLKSLELRMDSDFSFDIKFEGSGSAKLGYYTKAWDDVEKASLEVAGQSISLLGLSSDDKIGKYPIAGLVWSVPCPNTCPVVTGSTQGPLTQAKALGVIVWVCLNLKGELSLDGSVSLAKMKPADLSIGIEKKPDNDFEIIRSLEPKENDGLDFIVAPSVNGSLGLILTGGLSTDIDFFLSGVRLANAGLDVAAQSNMELNGEFGYGTDNLSYPWSWKGEGCFTSNVGAGIVAYAAANIGIEIDSIWDYSVSRGYEFQIPSKEDMEKAGWHGLWFTAIGDKYCWPDDDSDGVADVDDLCSNTPPSESVNSNGCSSSQIVVDSDGDGIANDFDSCPFTPTGESVDANGCSDSQNNSGDTIYSENFSSDPNFTSYSSTYAYWDPTNENYYVRSRDNLENKYWAHSPNFGVVDVTESVTIEIDISFENQDWGTYPGVRFYAYEPIEIHTDSNKAIFRIDNAYRNSYVRQIGIYDNNGNQYYTPQVADGSWHSVKITTDGNGKADILVTETETGNSIYSVEDVDFIISDFSYMGVGYYGSVDYGSDWSPIRIDNIKIEK